MPAHEAASEPIPGDLPVGESLRYDPLFDEIRSAREQDDPTLPQGEWVAPLKRADWPRVAELCWTALSERSKDLQLGVWYLEARVHTHGFEGMGHGLRVLSSLCREFWDDLHPVMEDDDLEVRLVPLEWLNSHLDLALKTVVVATDPTHGRAFTLGDWELVLYQENQARRSSGDADDEQEGELSKGRFLAAADAQGTENLVVQASAISTAIEALEELESVLAECCGEDKPSLAELAAVLGAADRLLNRLLEGREVAAPVAEIPEPESDPVSDREEAPMAESEAAASAESASTGPIQSRAEAYRRLAEVADYLMRHEPHSPTPYLVRRAVSWGGMSFSDLLQELLSDGADLGMVRRFLGLDERDQ